jgi:outer membrane protein with beta-barrel domain
MKIRSLSLTVLCVLVLAASAAAEPGAAFLEGRGGALFPVGNFSHKQDIGGAYSIAGGYEFLPFLDGLLEFTHSFNPSDDDHDHYRHGDVSFESDEVHQNFIVALGPRINFLPSTYRFRPYATVKGGWYHIANFNSLKVNGITVLSDNDDDAAGIEAGLGFNVTVFTLFEHEHDEVPLFEMTVGAHGSYHHAFLTGRTDPEFVTAMGSLGFRF